MNCKEILERISDYIDRDIDPKICDEMEKHLKECGPCVALLNTFKKSVELFSRSSTTRHDIPLPVSTNLMRFLKDEIGVK